MYCNPISKYKSNSQSFEKLNKSPQNSVVGRLPEAPKRTRKWKAILLKESNAKTLKRLFYLEWKFKSDSELQLKYSELLIERGCETYDKD